MNNIAGFDSSMRFSDIYYIFKNNVEPLFMEHQQYLNDHRIRYCFSAYMLSKWLNKEDKILDVGGSDVFAYLMRELGLKDITLLGHYDQERIKVLRKLEISFILCDNFNKDKLDIKNVYDALILFEVIEHLFDPMNLLLQLYDLCKEAGNIFCSTPNISSNYSIKRLKKFRNPYCYSFYSDKQLDIGHKREFTPLEIKQIMNFAGFNMKYLTTFKSDSDFERKDFLGFSRKILLTFIDGKFFEKKDLRGRTVFYIGAKGSKERQVRYPEDFYRSFTQP